MLGIIVLLLSITVTGKETRAVSITLHKKGFTGKDIAASKIAPFIRSKTPSHALTYPTIENTGFLWSGRDSTPPPPKVRTPTTKPETKREG